MEQGAQGHSSGGAAPSPPPGIPPVNLAFVGLKKDNTTIQEKPWARGGQAGSKMCPAVAVVAFIPASGLI